MKKMILGLAALFWLGLQPVSAKFILQELNFEDGAAWEMVGVSLYNYNIPPIQKEMGTFVMKNNAALRKMKAEWNLEVTYDDFCEHHYALKFYRNKVLVKTVKVNLLCNYLTDGLYSFKFKPEMLSDLRRNFTRIPFSKVSFSSLERLRKAIELMRKQPEIYFYGDVDPYRFDGFCMMKTDDVPWNVNRDSLKKALAAKIERATGSKEFYIEPYRFYFTDSLHITFRYFVYCNEWLAYTFEQKHNDILAHWRSHLAFRDPDDEKISIVIVGVDRKRYFQLMGDSDDDPLY